MRRLLPALALITLSCSEPHEERAVAREDVCARVAACSGAWAGEIDVSFDRVKGHEFHACGGQFRVLEYAAMRVYASVLTALGRRLGPTISENEYELLSLGRARVRVSGAMRRPFAQEGDFCGLFNLEGPVDLTAVEDGRVVVQGQEFSFQITDGEVSSLVSLGSRSE